MTRAFAVQRVAVPVAHRSARTFDDRYQRGEVVKLEPRFDHEVDMPAREQAVVVAVAAEEYPLVRCLRRERHEMLAVMVAERSEENTSELQSLMRNSYAVLCLKKKT